MIMDEKQYKWLIFKQIMENNLDVEKTISLNKKDDYNIILQIKRGKINDFIIICLCGDIFEFNHLISNAKIDMNNGTISFNYDTLIGCNYLEQYLDFLENVYKFNRMKLNI